MKKSSYKERDYTFGQLMLRLRTTINLTQAGLAEQLGVSRHAVGEWESGLSYPKAERLKQLILLAVRASAFAVGHEEEEIRALWKAARQKVQLDEAWLQVLFNQQESPFLSVSVEHTHDPDAISTPSARGEPRVDWGDALDVPSFYGREEELALLSRWVGEQHCRVVSVLGMGGIGKSALAVTLMHQVARQFEVVIWRSLRDVPRCSMLLDECLQVLAPHLLREMPDSLEGRLHLLMEQFRARRVLLVLDNLERLLEEGTGHMRVSYEGYAQLLRRMSETAHQSCLLLTSREKPADLVPLEGHRSPVRTVRLAGLDSRAGAQVLAEKEVADSPHDRGHLVEVYRGNPLALKIVAQTIVELFGGEIAPFLEQGEVVFGGVRKLLDEQFARLSVLEQRVFYWLAILREPVSLEELLAVLATPRTPMQVLEVLDSLRSRSLIEIGQRPGSFTLHSVVLEYATARLITEASREIEQGRLVHLIEHGLCRAHAKEYVREIQERLLLGPVLTELQRTYQGQADLGARLLWLLDWLRDQDQKSQGYGTANVVMLLRVLQGDLRGLDLSRLVIRGASLRGVEMQGAKLSGALLHETVFTETFDTSWGVAISRNGQYWAAGSTRGEVRVWRERGKVLHLAWQGHNDTVRALAFSPDGSRLATGSLDGAIKLWDIESGALLWTSWHTNNIQRIAFAPDGGTLASSGGDATIRLWDAKLGVHLQVLTSHIGPVHALAWSSDGSLLASGSFDGGIRLWEMRGAQPETVVRMLVGHTNWVTGLAFAPDGRTLASGSWDGTVRLWEVESLRCLQTLAGHTDRVHSVGWSPDGRTLASCGLDQTIWLWDAQQGSYRTVLHGHTAGVYDLAFTPDSRNLLSGSDDGTLRLWDVERGQCVHIMQGYAVSLYDVAWRPDGIQLASAGSDRLVTLWDVEGLTPPRMLHGHSWIPHGVAWSPDGQLLASSGEDNTVRVWNATTGASVQLLRDPDHAETVFYGVAWSPDGKFLASTSYQRGVQVWEVITSTRRWVGQAQPTRIRRVAWSPEGMQLASGGDDGSVCLWKASDGTLLQRFQGHRGLVMSVAWSPDGKRLASGGGDRVGGEIVIWEVRSGERLHIWSEPSAIVNAVTWSPTGAVLVTGHSDGTLHWWNVQSRECVQVRQGHQGVVQALEVNPEGQKLASCGDDGAIKLWNLQSAEQLRTLRRDRPYERLEITGIRGLSAAQKASLLDLGAFEETSIDG
jgi:WD40 repeat protein/transcriptional regulator with XRE-family HTH domain